MAIPFAFAISTSQQASQNDREEAGIKLPGLLGSCLRLQLKVVAIGLTRAATRSTCTSGFVTVVES